MWELKNSLIAHINRLLYSFDFLTTKNKVLEWTTKLTHQSQVSIFCHNEVSYFQWHWYMVYKLENLITFLVVVTEWLYIPIKYKLLLIEFWMQFYIYICRYSYNSYCWHGMFVQLKLPCSAYLSMQRIRTRIKNHVDQTLHF